MSIEAIAKDTFRNLPEEKRARILAAAADEFAINGYRQASLNSIVRKLGIAKGSLYQYFANKEALFLYVFDAFTLAVKRAVKASGASGDQDFFEITRLVLQAAIAFIDRHPSYYQIYLKVLFEEDVPQRNELISRVRLFSMEYFGPLCEAAKKQGVIRAELSTPMAVFLIDAVLDRFLMSYAGADPEGDIGLIGGGERIEEEIESIIGFLKNGMAVI